MAQPTTRLCSHEDLPADFINVVHRDPNVVISSEITAVGRIPLSVWADGFLVGDQGTIVHLAVEGLGTERMDLVGG